MTAHLVVSPPDIPPDWRLEEVAGKLRYHWKDFARTCGFDSEVVDDIDSVSLLLRNFEYDFSECFKHFVLLECNSEHD